MARSPLLQLSGVSLTFGGDPILSPLDLSIQSGDRIALVGRNGSGKSTLLKLIAGVIEPDGGERSLRSGASVGWMEQDPDMSGHATLGGWAAAALSEGGTYLLEAAAEGLKFDPETPVATASGGERRRAALARLMAESPDLMLLDEPTNHLDVQAIEWLETQLSESRAAHVVISHDRAILRALTRSILWLDRGVLRRLDKGFDAFEAWRDETWAAEDLARHKLDRKIKSEARWAVEGISARRKRNQGRVRALQALRAERQSMIRREGTAALAAESERKSGKLVTELTSVSKRYGDKVILRDVSLRVGRGDRVALVGPNGAGKTTLLKIMTGTLAPDDGTVRLGTNLDIAVFDQARAALDPDLSLWDSLTSDKDMRVGGRADQVMVRGTPRHVVGYLKDFLFDDAQARAPIRSLSGGEKARLLLAKLLAKPANLLVLDEPTNDLDVETLDLLEEIVGDFDGTVLLVSHDRDFLDRVATQTLVLEPDGRVTAYAGGWSDMRAQRGSDTRPVAADKRPGRQAEKPRSPARPAPKSGLSFTERHRLDALPGEIERLEAEIAKLETLLSDPGLYTREPVKFGKATEALAARQALLSQAEEDWLLLEEKAAGGA